MGWVVGFLAIGFLWALLSAFFQLRPLAQFYYEKSPSPAFVRASMFTMFVWPVYLLFYVGVSIAWVTSDMERPTWLRWPTKPTPPVPGPGPYRNPA